MGVERFVMGQKSLNFSVKKCIPAQFNSGLCQVTYQTTKPSCKFVDAEWREEPGVQQQRRYTTEELSRWIQRFTKAKIASRKQHDLRREVLLHNAFIFAQSEVRCRQVERQKRWKELKPLLFLETTALDELGRGGENKMAASAHKMADGVQQMAVEEEMDLERPSTPLPSVTAASKRHRCGCLPSNRCDCGIEDPSIPQAHKKFRPSSRDEDDDLKSLDRFLLSLHCNSRQVG